MAMVSALESSACKPQNHVRVMIGGACTRAYARMAQAKDNGEMFSCLRLLPLTKSIDEGCELSQASNFECCIMAAALSWSANVNAVPFRRTSVMSRASSSSSYPRRWSRSAHIS
jgi:hypothetical protein